ncbi:hypothetical protein BU251_01680 [Candidatus Velamenicoccus archaeovorus]|uniref:ParB/Sulfiredoxin domain-containing protein n=1 Tax=Velamenicoccus archaeovorus TaxID=1930593 RepID=A0A410P2V2_VELA1|nr:hypothetical protein [Candidatus Velamenicoccus archaeovorus]QAT16525.1 hypothetical protein BU251_01680 [Candidatus Velamenicoccus archaeovorus]
MKKQIVNYQDKWEENKVKVDDLNLDVNNIRLEIKHESEKEIANDLFINEDAMDILENIYENGFFPDESPIVIKENNKLVVLEGNRRVVSLKAMVHPEIAPEKYASKIKKMMEGRLPITDILVRVATSRDEAMEYLSAKHTKTTRRPWSALRRAYFYYAQKERGQAVTVLMDRYKGVDIPAYIRMFEMHNVAKSLKNIPEEIRKKIANKGVFNITTLERLYSDKYVQQKLGIDFDKTTGEVSLPINASFDKVFSKVVSDIVSGVATSRKWLSHDEDRKKYIDSVISEILEGKEIDTRTKKSASEFKAISYKKKRKSLVEKSFVCTLDAPGIGRVLWELQNLEYKSFPNAAADLLRTFLEKTLKKYLEQLNALPNPRRTGGYIYLDDVLTKMSSDLQKLSKHQIVQIIAEIKNNKWYLESINHNPDIFAVEYRVEEAWDLICPLVKFIFNECKKKVESK